MYRFLVINADGKTIRTIIASNHVYASKKLKVLFGDNTCFLKLKRDSKVTI